MKIIPAFLLLVLFNCAELFAQVAINSDSSAPLPSAMLDLKSTSQGFLLPRMTRDQIIAIPNPADGLQVYCTTDRKLYIYLLFSGQWKELAYGTTSLSPALCGSGFTVNHIAGGVAPVTKTVLYGTVKNVPGEPAKCWITRNLGASRQATAMDDDTEASAGWYWQFNRRQGYRHDGTVATPVWIAPPNSLNTDWQSANDPCTIELGAAWRIPTRTEWFNVDNTGEWMSVTQSFNSLLKIHAAVSVIPNGELSDRGANGNYWSSTQCDSVVEAYQLQMTSQSCAVSKAIKNVGFPIRCLRE